MAGRDEVAGFGDGLADNPIGAFGLADHFAEMFFALTVRGALDAAFLHFFVNHTTEIDFGDAAVGEVIDGDRFAATTHTDEGKDFDIF